MEQDFEKLYDALYMKVFSYVMTLCGNRDAAEEVTQTAFFKALSAKNKFRAQADVFTWLCAIAKHAWIDLQRADKRRAAQPLDDLDLISNTPDISHRLEKNEASAGIHRIVHEMSEPYKEVFYLRVFGELPFAEIGSIFGKTENWARVTFHRAKLKINERLVEDEIQL